MSRPVWVRMIPAPFKRFAGRVYWLTYDLRDFLVEAVGWLPSHAVRLLLYRYVFRVRIGRATSIHRNCRLYRPNQVSIGSNCVVNRDVLLDGRSGLNIGDNVSISEGCMLLTLEHDPSSLTFANRGSPTTIGDRAFLGVRALILPGRCIGEGAVIAAGSVVTKDVPPFAVVAGQPARQIGERTRDLNYTLEYAKFLG